MKINERQEKNITPTAIKKKENNVINKMRITNSCGKSRRINLPLLFDRMLFELGIAVKSIEGKVGFYIFSTQ